MIALTLFNLYFAMVMEQWRIRCREFRVDVMYKCGGKLVGERTRRPLKVKATELLFADDDAAVSVDRNTMERAAEKLEKVIKAWGLTLSVGKTKLLVAGALGTEDEARPIMLEGGEVECVTNFKYLGSVLEANGGVGMDVGERIAKAARAFGALKGLIFNNSNLSYKTKKMVYKAVVLGVLLYGSETWTTKRDATKKMKPFHNRCLRQIVGITSAQQRTELISSVQVAYQFGMEESLEDIVIARRLRWLGHLARMDDHRLPKKKLFGWLPQRRPAHGTRMRWRDCVRKDLNRFNIDDRKWYQLAQDRSGWRRSCRTGLEDVTSSTATTVLNTVFHTCPSSPLILCHSSLYK